MEKIENINYKIVIRTVRVNIYTNCLKQHLAHSKHSEVLAIIISSTSIVCQFPIQLRKNRLKNTQSF